MNSMYYEIIDTLYLLKGLDELGFANMILKNVQTIDPGDMYEYLDLGFENAAPYYRHEEVDVWADDDESPDSGEIQENYVHEPHFHVFMTYRTDNMLEYFRLCDLYEASLNIKPSDNKFRHIAFTDVGRYSFAWDFDPYGSLVIEYCAMENSKTLDMLFETQRIIRYFDENICKLRLALLLSGPIRFVPALPPCERTEHDDV